MLDNLQLLPGAVSDIFASAAETGVLTVSDRYGLMAAAMTHNLDEEEARAINRLLRAVLRGRVQLAESC
jgi:hypothetical protein